MGGRAVGCEVESVEPAERGPGLAKALLAARALVSARRRDSDAVYSPDG